MKKYIIPALRVADIENEVLMLDGSNFGVGGPITGTEPGFEKGARDRGFFDWNDDEEE